MPRTRLNRHRWAAARQELRARRAAHGERVALARALAVYDSPADLIELSAILDRHDGAETDTLRDLVDWTRAA